MRRWIQIGLLILVALMPFHAFLSVWLGHLTGQQTIIQAWKELLLLVLSVMAVVMVMRDHSLRQRFWNLPAILAGCFGLVAVVVTLALQPAPTAAAFGLKTDLEFLIAFGLAMMVTSAAWVQRLNHIVLAGAAVVVAFGLLQVTILPADFLAGFGYGPDTVPPYLTLDAVLGGYRFGSTLGGPNQLGTYLLLPLALAAALALRQRRQRLLHLALIAAGLAVLLHTYSRSAWLGAVVGAAILAVALAPARYRVRTSLMVGAGVVATGLLLSWLAEHVRQVRAAVFHANPLTPTARSSDSDHLSSLTHGLQAVASTPLGNGLGTAGPATFHTSAPFIIENNYLQIAYETGWLGLVAFVATIVATGRALIRQAAQHPLAAAAAASLAGVSIAALFLPAWTDSTTALITWTAAGSIIGLGQDRDHV